MKFNDLDTTKKGDIGEEIILGLLQEGGWTPYKVACDCPHPFDYFSFNSSQNRTVFFEVKTYPRRASYNDTGIDLPDYHKYLSFSDLDCYEFILFFVDEFEQCIYCQNIRKLSPHGVIREDHGKVYFPLAMLKKCRNLYSDELQRLREISKVDQVKYASTKRHFT